MSGLQYGKYSYRSSGSFSANNINHNYKIEYNNVWNLSVERSLSSTTSFQAQYIGSYTVHADNETYQNLFPDNALPAGPLHVRPIPAMSGFASVTWDGWEKYNALALTFTQRALARPESSIPTTPGPKHWMMRPTPGRTMPGPTFLRIPANLAAEKGLSDFDHRHRFVTNFLYQIPVPEKFARLDSHRVWRVAGGRDLDTSKAGRPLR